MASQRWPRASRVTQAVCIRHCSVDLLNGLDLTSFGAFSVDDVRRAGGGHRGRERGSGLASNAVSRRYAGGVLPSARQRLRARRIQRSGMWISRMCDIFVSGQINTG
jgi:hypothetical protein